MKTYILRALADNTRLKLISAVSKGEVCACRLPKAVKKSQPAVSQHLKVLLTAGLFVMRKDGAKRLYSLSKKGRCVLKDMQRWQEYED